MRALMLALEAPLPPINGLRLPLIELLPRLAAGCDLRVLAFRLPGQEGSVPAGVDVHLVDRVPDGRVRDAVGLARALASGRAMRVDRSAELLRAALREHLADFRPDVVHVFSGRLAAVHADLGRPAVLTALDAWHRNVAARADLATGLRRRLLQGEERRVRAFVQTEFARYERVVTVTAEDRAELAALDPSMRLTVVPNGVDAARFTPDAAPARVPDRLVLHGVMDYAPNVAAAQVLVEEVLPHVQAARPQAEVMIIGRSPAAEVRALASRPGVTVTGDVGEIAPWLAGGAVYVAPMRTGTGIKNKLLEAMASATPVVGTPLAFQGLDVTPGVNAAVAVTAEEIAAAVVALLDDPDRAARMGAAGREHVVAHLSWDAAARAYLDLYGEVVAEEGR